MVLKFSVNESRFVNMGVNFLKRLIQEAKYSNDVVTLEATVITGFEGQAIDECKEKCQPLNCGRAKGRIFFNIKKDTFPNVLKMRSIDNVFLVCEAFEELKLKKVKDEDLLVINGLVDKVDWNKFVPGWAQFVGFKGMQFPKCAQIDPAGLMDEKDHVCQSCRAKWGEPMQIKDDSVPLAESGSAVSDSRGKDCDSPKATLVPTEEILENLPGTMIAGGAEGTIEVHSSSELRGPELIKPVPSNGDGKGDVGENQDSALESSPKVQPTPVNKDESDDESAFHSAEEDLPIAELKIEEPIVPLDHISHKEKPSCCVNGSNDPQTGFILTDEIKSTVENEPSPRPMGGLAPERAKRERSKKKKCDKRRGGWEAKDDQEVMKSDDASKIADAKTDSECVSLGSNETVSNESVSQPTNGDQKNLKDEGKKKGYWAKRREARAKKDAEAKAKKPPRKAYVDDGIMKFRVTCYRSGPKHSFDSNDAAGHFGGRINDKFHWTVDLTRYDINVVLVIEDDSAYVTLALTNKSLHKRNIKHFGPTTLRATLCHGLLRLAEPMVGDIVMDPMCGGGSIPIEGALSFPGTYHICGDVNGKSVAMTGDNIVYNSKDKPLLVDAIQWSVRRLPLQDHSIDVFVTDLPFGLRVGKQKDNTGLYIAALKEAARVVRPCGRASLLTYDKTAMIRALQRTGNLWREIRATMVNQGGLRCYAYLLLRRSLPSEPVQKPSQELPSNADDAGGIEIPRDEPEVDDANMEREGSDRFAESPNTDSGENYLDDTKRA